MTNREYIEKEIAKMPSGRVFIVSDFSEIASYDNIRQIISRLENDGKIRRILPGVYDKPFYSKIIDEYAAPDPNSVAEAIARKNNWAITPSGNVALNLLGLSTQVPAKWEYYSSGKSHEYDIDGVTISFTHRADRELYGMSKKTAMIIQAIKALGKGKISDEDISKIRSKINDDEKAQLLTEAKQTINWIYDVVKIICSEENNV